MKETWLKVVEYSSMPYHGFTRRLRKGYTIEFNGDGKVLEGEVMFDLNDSFLRVFIEDKETAMNMYLDWEKIASIKTFAPLKEAGAGKK